MFESILILFLRISEILKVSRHSRSDLVFLIYRKRKVENLSRKLIKNT